MKKTTKSFLTTALILVCAGCVLALLSMIFASVSGVDIYGVEKLPRMSENKDYALSEILKDSPEADYTRELTTDPFTRIEVVSYVGKVEIVPTTDETHVELTRANTDNMIVQVIGSTLTIAEQREVGVMGVFVGEKGFSFRGLRQIFGPGNSANTKKVITVYLNEDDFTESISVHSSIGDVRVNGVKGTGLSVHSTIGKVFLEASEFDRVDVSSTFGTLRLIANHFNSLNAAVHFGKVIASLPYSEAQSAVFDIWVGKLSVDTEEPLSDFKLMLTTTLGSIYKNGSKSGSSLQEFSTTANRISSTVLLGKISVNGAAEAEPSEAITFEEALETVTAETAPAQPGENEDADGGPDLADNAEESDN